MNSMFMDEARMFVQQCWDTVETQQDEKNSVFAENVAITVAAFAENVARTVAAWMDTAAQHARNEEFYRDLLDKCAEHLGAAAYEADDGTVMEDPVRLKIPMLVADFVKELSNE